MDYCYAFTGSNRMSFRSSPVLLRDVAEKYRPFRPDSLFILDEISRLHPDKNHRDYARDDIMGILIHYFIRRIIMLTGKHLTVIIRYEIQRSKMHLNEIN